MTKLVIVESPAKCKKIEKFLGPGYKCAASFGHIRDLDGGLKAIDLSNNFTPSFKVLKAKMKYVTKLHALVKKSTEVILATDDDREGEAIAWHLCKVFKLPVATTKRIIFHEITKNALIKAINNPTRVDMNMVHAQQSRQILDIMVGFTISPILWKHISRNTKTGLSAGRCQTPALRIIYDRQKEIEENPGKKVYNTIGNFTKKNIEFKLNNHYDKEDDIEEFLVQSCDFAHILNVSNPKIVTKKPPLPFTTSALQQKASNELHFSPKQTMKIAQTLYENGYITYMRTDSKTYSKEFIDKTKDFIKQRYGREYIHSQINYLDSSSSESSPKKEQKEQKEQKEHDDTKQKKKNNKKNNKKNKKQNNSNAQEAHEAIRPTEIYREDLSEAIDSRGKRLYALIRRNTLESCMSEAEYYSITANISAPESNIYRHTAELVKFPGWKIVGGYEKTNPIYTFLENKKQIPVEYNKIYAKLTLKDLKTRYTEARLVQQLEKLGIGRPSTFSSIISKIQERKYVLKTNVEGKTHSCIDYQLIGNNLMEFLCKHFDSLFMYGYTKSMEDSLDSVSKGKKTRANLCGEFFDEIINLSSKIQKANKELFRIDDSHVYVIAKYGPVIKCDVDGVTTWKKIKKGITLDDIRNKQLSVNDIVDTEKSFTGRNLGAFKNHDAVLKKGKFGLFVNWNGKNYSVGFLKKRENTITLEDIIDILSGKKSSNPNVLKIITEEITIRKGKYGPYIFYKTANMKKPRFLKLKNFEWETLPSAAILTWIKTEYNI